MKIDMKKILLCAILLTVTASASVPVEVVTVVADGTEQSTQRGVLISLQYIGTDGMLMIIDGDSIFSDGFDVGLSSGE